MPMNDDRCLRDDPALPLALRRDLDRYAQSTAVVYDEEQGLARLAASLAIASTAAATPSLATGLKTLATKALASPWFHALLVCVAVGATGAAIVGTEHARERAMSPVPVSTAPGARPKSGEHAMPVGPPAEVAPEPPEPARVDPATTSPARPTVTPKVSARPMASARPAAPAPAAGPSLHEEMSALLHLREVASSDPAVAAGLAAEDDARFGHGSFYAEEREAIAIDALAQSGRTEEARARARAFLDLHPKSSFAAIVRGVLAP